MPGSAPERPATVTTTRGRPRSRRPAALAAGPTAPNQTTLAAPSQPDACHARGRAALRADRRGREAQQLRVAGDEDELGVVAGQVGGAHHAVVVLERDQLELVAVGRVVRLHALDHAGRGAEGHAARFRAVERRQGQHGLAVRRGRGRTPRPGGRRTGRPRARRGRPLPPPRRRGAIAGTSSTLNLIIRPADVTAPMVARTVVASAHATRSAAVTASGRRRRGGPAPVRLLPGFPAGRGRAGRSADSTTRHGSSVTSSGTAAATAAPASISTVRRGVPNFFATSAISPLTRFRSTSSLSRISVSSAISARSVSCSRSSSSLSKRVSRRSGVSRMYCAWISDRSKIWHRPALGLGRVVAGPDDRDDLVDVEQRDEDAVDQVQPVLALLPAELAAPPGDVDAVLDVDAEQFLEAERARLAVDQGDVVDAERLFHRREPVQLGEDGLGVEAGPDLDDQVQAAVAVGQVLEVGDAGDLLGLDEVLDPGDDLLRADAVGQLGHHDAGLAGVELLDRRSSPGCGRCRARSRTPP